MWPVRPALIVERTWNQSYQVSLISRLTSKMVPVHSLFLLVMLSDVFFIVDVLDVLGRVHHPYLI